MEQCQGVYTPLDDRTRLTSRSLCRLKGRWIRLTDLLQASKWIHLVDPLLALPKRGCIFLLLNWVAKGYLEDALPTELPWP